MGVTRSVCYWRSVMSTLAALGQSRATTCR
jgi:hypothetical protein